MLSAYIMALEPISKTYFINLSHQSMCLYLYRLSLLGNDSIKTLPLQRMQRNNRRIVGGVVFCAVRVVTKESRRLVLPRTSWNINGLHLTTNHRSPRGGGFKYLHLTPASRRRRWKWNPVPEGITGPTCSWGIKIRGPGPPGLGACRMWDSKIWLCFPRDSVLGALARASNNCRRQTRPLVREGAPH
jgi:hypothetical protein